LQAPPCLCLMDIKKYIVSLPFFDSVANTQSLDVKDDDEMGVEKQSSKKFSTITFATNLATLKFAM
jgi:hypothetical protein